MSIIQLNNPKTERYNNLKNLILDGDINWFYHPTTTPASLNYNDYTLNKNIFNPPMYSHIFLLRTDLNNLYAKVNSPYMDDVNKMYCEIFNDNMDVMKSFNMMCRCAVNAVQPSEKEDTITVPHTDHDFPHKNMLIYLTDAGGSTFVEGEEFAPEEDDVIIFQGEHWHELPKQKRRVVLVMTYI